MLYALMVTRNESRRFFELAVNSLKPVVDEIFVYDDQSTDGTVSLAGSLGCHVWSRPRSVPSFLAHEGKFRQAAWDAFCATVMPGEGDWVLAIDADEVLVAERPPRELLLEVARESDERGVTSRRVMIPEVWEVEFGVPYVRVDGYWGDLEGVRFFAYQEGGEYRDMPMACGSAPTHATESIGETPEGIWLLHLGYLRPEDRVAKHDRYLKRGGHNPKHVASILGRAEIIPWDGPVVLGLQEYLA